MKPDNAQQPHLSIVLPAFEEETRLGESLPRILEYLASKAWTFEILVVDDGSADRTAEVAEEKLDGVPHRVLRNDRNRGKGYSVRRGMLEARGQYVLFSDTDLSTPVEEVENLIRAIDAGTDVAIGSRALENSLIEKHQPWRREILGKLFNRFLQILVIRGLQDTQCGFKCFRRDVVEPIFTHQTIDGWAFDVEILFIARQLGYRITEVPVRWLNSEVTKVDTLADGMRMVWDALRVRGIHRRLQGSR